MGGTADERRDALVERLWDAMQGTLDLYLLYLGSKLGLYETIARLGGVTSVRLAAEAGIAERYAREWLEAQAVGGTLEVDDAGEAPQARRYSLPAGHDEALLDRDSLSFMPPVGFAAVSIGSVMPRLLEAFRTGGGVPYEDYGEDLSVGSQEGFSRPMFLNQLGTDWFPAIPEVDERLRAEPAARVADVACGAGWSSIAIARAYPLARVSGLDLDVVSIASARANLEGSGIEDRVSFDVRDAADPALEGRFDLVTIFEALHDMSRPVEALEAVRGLLAADGIALVVDERAGERFDAPRDDVERLLYGFSVLHCLPVGMADQPSAGTGTLMRPDTLRDYAQAAGFAGVDVLPVEHDQFRFYRLWR